MVNKKSIWLIIIVLLFSITVVQVSGYFIEEVKTRILVGDKEINLEGSIIELDDKLYVPLREFASTIGYEVDWKEGDLNQQVELPLIPSHIEWGQPKV